MSVKQKLLLYAAPMLLVVVACWQKYLVYTHNLDAWRGGGFGMFSAIRGVAVRNMSVTLITTNDEELHCPPGDIENRIPLGGDMIREKKELYTLPRQGRLNRLAERLAEGEWVAYRPPNSTVGLPLMKQDVPASGETRPLHIREVRVELWEYKLNDDVRRYRPNLRQFRPAMIMSATASVKEST